MLDNRAVNIHEMIWESAARVGSNAPKVADDILAQLFPKTAAAAEEEGADRILRTGFIMFVKGVLRAPPVEDAQRDFDEIDETFTPLVKRLHSRTYWVTSAGEYVDVPRLIADPELLDDARRFMRIKGQQCIAEADRLDALYAAVTAA